MWASIEIHLQDFNYNFPPEQLAQNKPDVYLIGTELVGTSTELNVGPRL